MSSRRLAAAFVLCLGLALLALVDFRRGFLFAAYPVRTLFYVFSLWQVPIFAAGVVGMFVCHRALRVRETHDAGAARLLKPLTFAILALLVIDLFAYRGVPAARSMVSGRINVDWLNVSLPCMMLLGGSLQRFRMVALLSVAVMIVGVVAGAMFL